MVFMENVLVFITFAFIFKYIYDLIFQKSREVTQQIKSPELYPIVGNVHLVLGRELIEKVSSTLRKYSTPLRIKCGNLEVTIVDNPKDIEKLMTAVKSELYEVIPFNNGLFSIKGMSI